MPRKTNLIEKELSYRITGILFNIHNDLGRYCLEKQYGDALANRLKLENINFIREHPIELEGRKSNFVDFIIEDKIIIELKAKPFITKNDYYQTRRYLELLNLELGIIVDFRQKYLKPKRILNPKYSEHLDKFVNWDYIKAFTVVELLVAMGLFVVLIGIATGGFIKTLRTQKAVVGLMAANDNMNLALEQMAREIRTGYHFSKISDTEFQFVNANNQVVWYRLNEGAIEKGTEDILLNRTYKKITADNIRVINFKIELFGNNSGDGYPPRITISLSITGTDGYLENITTNIQTTISARVLDT